MPSPSTIVLGVGRPNLRTPMRGPWPSSVVTSLGTLSITDKNSSISIDASGLVATDTGGAVDHAGRGTTATTAIGSGDKRYFEVTITNQVNAGVGVANASAPFLDSNYLGHDVNSWSYYFDGSIYNSGSNIGSTSAYTTADRINVAVHGGNKLWVGKNGTFSGDPVAGTGGFDISAAGTVYPAYNLKGGGILTFNFGSTFADTPPAGFTAIP